MTSGHSLIDAMHGTTSTHAHFAYMHVRPQKRAMRSRRCTRTSQPGTSRSDLRAKSQHFLMGIRNDPRDECARRTTTSTHNILKYKGHQQLTRRYL
jgi:hypothetical protein